MRHVTRYRAYPKWDIERKLFSSFDRCTFVRTYCLENKVFKDSILPVLKQEHPELKEVHSIVLQNVIHQLVDNMRALKKLKENGRKIGRLRIKRVHSMVFEQTGFKVQGNTLWLSKIGSMRIEISRPIEGTIKQIIVKHNKTHKWFVSIISETPDTPEMTEGTRCVGIDLNVMNFSTDSDGKVFEHPHNVRKSAMRLRRAQKKLSRKVKGSINRRKQRLVVARIHERVENRRNDFLHKWSRYYVDAYDHIGMEDLQVKNLAQSPIRGLNKSILDAAWGKARMFVEYKAENAGKYAHFVNPAYTSQRCSRCGCIVKKKLSDRVHVCPQCGYLAPRDFNAAVNIKQNAVGWDTPESTLVEIGTSTRPAMDVQAPVDEARISPL